MKKYILTLALVLSALCLLGSCRRVPKNVTNYVDDAVKYVDDYVDDALNGRKRIRMKRAPRAPREKMCNTCRGYGRVQDYYGSVYQCPDCGGDGKVWFN